MDLLCEGVYHIIWGSMMLRDGWIDLKQCLHYQDTETLKEGNAGCCNLGSQTECNGKVHFCENPEALKQYLLERGLGWQKKKGKERFKKMLQAIVRLKNPAWGKEKTEPTKIVVHERSIFL